MKKILMAVAVFATLGAMTSCKNCTCKTTMYENDKEMGVEVSIKETQTIAKDKLPEGMSCKDYEDMLKDAYEEPGVKTTVKCNK